MPEQRRASDTEGIDQVAIEIQQGTPHERGPTQSVYWRIRQKILRNEIAPASRINIDRLARELEVSSTPVREALKQLQGDNLVVQELGRGYSTTPLLGRDELRAMFEFRLLVEPWAASAAAQNRLRNPGHLLERQLSDLEMLIDSHPDVRYELVEHDTTFHDTILASVENEVLHSAYTQTHCHLHAFRLYPNDYTGKLTIAEHRDVANAIRERDPAAAEAAMRAHLVDAYLRFSEGHTEAIAAASAPLLPGLHPERPSPATELAI